MKYELSGEKMDLSLEISDEILGCIENVVEEDDMEPGEITGTIVRRNGKLCLCLHAAFGGAGSPALQRDSALAYIAGEIWLNKA
ncbi:MAG TPA: hypothetical protein IAB55_07800 [Candidatus Merdivicinus faecavium]|nr:hypothetical protein [Candidatus Merdivicinus faecavium]